MKKITLPLTLTLFLLTFYSIAQEATPAHKDSIDQIVSRYYTLSLKIYQLNSQVSDVDQLFNLFTDDFEYIHPKYGGTYPRKELYQGYLRNQKNGAYNGSIVDVKLSNKIIGLNAVVTERTYIKREQDGSLVEVDPGMTLFEFEDGKISMIKEYW